MVSRYNTIFTEIPNKYVHFVQKQKNSSTTKQLYNAVHVF